MGHRRLRDAIGHERELREIAERGIIHERELRQAADDYERELRRQVEAGVAANLERQAAEYERRLDELNHAHARSVEERAHSVNRELYDVQHALLAQQVDRLVAQVGVWRGIVVFLGVPGVVALLWVLLAAVSGHTVTGPDGLLP